MVQSQSAGTETGLIELAQHGDRNAFGELVRRHYQGVVLVVTRMCGDTGLAEDAAQEAFMRAWVNLPSFQPRRQPAELVIPDRHQRRAGCPASQAGRDARR